MNARTVRIPVGGDRRGGQIDITAVVREQKTQKVKGATFTSKQGEKQKQKGKRGGLCMHAIHMQIDVARVYRR